MCRHRVTVSARSWYEIPPADVPMTNRFKITVDRELCLGSGVCIMYSPQTFAHDAEAKATVVNPQGNSLAAVQISVEACPTGALQLIFDDQNDPVIDL